MSTTEAQTLACGADLMAIVRQVTDGAPAQDAEHQLSCPFCQAAIAAVRRVGERVRELADVPVSIPASFARGIMGRLAAERSPVAVESRPGGETTVAERLVAEVAREAARGVDGVVYASAGASSEAASEAFAVHIRVRLVVSFGPSMPVIADAVRAAVAAEVAELCGLVADPVEVRIDDVL